MPLGFKLSEETKAKISAANKGREKPPSQGRKLSEYWKKKYAEGYVHPRLGKGKNQIKEALEKEQMMSGSENLMAMINANREVVALRNAARARLKERDLALSQKITSHLQANSGPKVYVRSPEQREAISKAMKDSYARRASKKIHLLSPALKMHPIAPTDSTVKLSNPKDLIGSGKMPLHLWPETATMLGSLGLLDGMLKYGRSNFREIGVRASIYYDAAKRHLNAWFEGEECDPDSGLPHLAHALACIAIIVDADAAGKLRDDRMVKGGYRKLLTELTPHVARLKALHASKNPKHYTIADNKASEIEARQP